jgi:hypothetical protein
MLLSFLRVDEQTASRRVPDNGHCDVALSEVDSIATGSRFKVKGSRKKVKGAQGEKRKEKKRGTRLSR